MSEISWGPIGEAVYDRTYSRTKKDGTKETWPETVTRAVRGNSYLVPPVFLETNEVEAVDSLIENFQLMPAGRHLWVSGVPGRQYLFNCHRAGWVPDAPAEHFCFTFDELMKGGGVGANYSDDYINDLPAVCSRVELTIRCDPDHPDFDELKVDLRDPQDRRFWVVPDSREGWVEALQHVIERSMSTEKSWLKQQVNLDLSLVRERGTEIKGFGGTASGPGPLVLMLRQVNDLLNRRFGHRLTSLDAMTIDHLIASCVVSGNVRRSARMSMKLWSDPDIFEFIECKNGGDSHWTTNISVEINDAYDGAIALGDTHALAVRDAVASAMLTRSEPGLFHSDNAAEGESRDVRCTNPCGEIALEDWENCNLGHINLGAFAEGTLQELKTAARLMTRFLIRATFSDITNTKQREVVDRNRRIGVGLYGVQLWGIKNGIRYSELPYNDDFIQLQRTIYSVVRDEADQYSAELGIPSPIKVTTVAPTGTIAKLSGSSEGGQAIYAKHFIRRIRYASNAVPQAMDRWHQEPDLVSADTTVVSVPCEDQMFMMTPPNRHHLIEDASDLDLRQQLAMQTCLQLQWADNAVSYTANIWPGEYHEDQIKDLLDSYMPFLKGTTVMIQGHYEQAPYERITRQQYDAMLEDTDLGLGFVDTASDECSTGACPVR